MVLSETKFVLELGKTRGPKPSTRPSKPSLYPTGQSGEDGVQLNR